MPGHETPNSREKRSQGAAAQRASQRQRLRRTLTMFLLVLLVAFEVIGSIHNAQDNAMRGGACAAQSNWLPPPLPLPPLGTAATAAGVQGVWGTPALRLRHPNCREWGGAALGGGSNAASSSGSRSSGSSSGSGSIGGSGGARSRYCVCSASGLRGSAQRAGPQLPCDVHSRAR